MNYNGDASAVKFVAFHMKNREVYWELRRLAFKLVNRGHKKYGIGSLVEAFRWHRAMKTSDDDFKINNNYRAYYARLLMHNEMDLRGFFTVREQLYVFDYASVPV